MFSLLATLPLLASNLVAASPGTSPVDSFQLFKRVSSGCSTSGPASCHNTTVETDLCCFESPGGLILQTQFWDTDPSTGPTNSWTIHGLWPDLCSGSYTENCDSSRDYTDIGTLLTDQGASDTLDYMNTYWINDPDDGSNEEFWEHEWATHGTCYSTLEPSCLPSGSAKGAEAVAFFQTVVGLFQTLPTYQWLADADITPSSTKTYSAASMLDALKSGYGEEPALYCTSGAVSSIEYYFNLKGSVIDGDFVPIAAPSAGSCSGTVSYKTKTGSPAPTSTTSSSSKTTSTTKTTTTKTKTTTSKTKTTTSTSPTSTPSSIPSKATITSSTTGGLLSAGTLSTQTLATYTLSGSATSFTMKTSKGSCGVSSGQFECGSSVSASTFSAVSSGGDILLAYEGSTAFSSDSTPSGETQETVYTGSSHDETFTLTIVST